jgi:hypothetical protein
MYEGRRPDIRESDRLFWVLVVRFFPRWRDSLVVVRPDEVVVHRRHVDRALPLAAEDPLQPRQKH